jgi:hypothetical protein
MTAHRSALATGLCLLAIVTASDSAKADQPAPSALGSLRSVDTVQSLFFAPPATAPGAVPPPQARTVAQPQAHTLAQPQARTVASIPGMPRDGGTNLQGLLRDPRASRVTPAGVRLADPGWMRTAPKDRR